MMPSWLDGGETESSVFTKRSKAPAVLRALEAATEALERFEALNKARKERGRVQVRTGCIWASFTYDNVGATDRLDFTVIGPAVKGRLHGCGATVPGKHPHDTKSLKGLKQQAYRRDGWEIKPSVTRKSAQRGSVNLPPGDTRQRLVGPVVPLDTRSRPRKAV
jgi:hypothetical protein